MNAFINTKNETFDSHLKQNILVSKSQQKLPLRVVLDFYLACPIDLTQPFLLRDP